MRDAVDEQIGVVAGQADHAQDLAGARVHRDGRPFVLAEGGHHRALQVGVYRQAQIRTRLRRDPADGADGTPLHVGFDLLVTDLPAQILLVVALQPGFAHVGERSIALAQHRQVFFVDPAHIADDVREQRAVGITPGQIRLQLHTGEAPALHRKASHLFIAHAQLERHRQEAAARAALAVEALQILRRDRDHLAQRVQHGVHVGDLVGGHVQTECRHVLGQQPAGAVVDHAAPGHHRLGLDAVGLRAGGVDLVVEHLQLEIPAAQADQADHHHRKAQHRAAAELFGLRMRILRMTAPVHGLFLAPLAQPHRIQHHEQRRPQGHAQQRRPPVAPRQGRLAHGQMHCRRHDAVVEQQPADC